MNAFKIILAVIGLAILLPILFVVGGMIAGAGWQTVVLTLALVAVAFNKK